MYILLKNETCFSQIDVIYKGNSYLLKKDEGKEVFIDSLNVELDVFVPEENRVLFNLFFALIDGFSSEENIICSFNCNFKVSLCLTEDTSEVVFKDITARDDKNGYIYNSLFVQPQNFTVVNMNYYLYNTKKSRRKALFYLAIITSWLPILCFLLLKLLLSGNIYAIIAFFVVLLVFSVPSWKKANRIKLYFSDEKATEMIVNEYRRLELNNWNTNIVPSGYMDKAIFKILDFILGKNKKRK